MKSQSAYGIVEVKITAQLTGTEKQIAWANQLRERAVADILSRMTESPVAMRAATSEVVAQFERAVNAETTTQFWINSRTALKSVLLDKLLQAIK